MGNIYNSLKNVFQILKKENNSNIAFGLILIVLFTIPLSYALNSVATGMLLLITIFTFQKKNFTFQLNLIYPILLYVLMLLSFFWSIDQKTTLTAILKEIPLLIIPLAFMLFKDFSKDQKQKIIQFYSYGILLFTVFYYLKAIIRFILSHNTEVFFYHELVTKDVNAIHVSVYVSMAFFHFFIKIKKEIIDYIAMTLLFAMVFLLASKNIIIVFIGLLLIYYLFLTKISRRMRMRNLILFLLFLFSLSFVGKIRDRFMVEIQTNTKVSLSADVDLNKQTGINNISIVEAWTKEYFAPSDYFPGTAFRVYQFRMFLELFHEEPVFWTGYGLNASKEKLLEKEKKYNLHEGYGTYNFHNQYIQNFAELGVFGFVLLMIMLVLNVRNAFKSKDFIHFAFAILMISLFLTESFLWRQRGVVFFTIMYCLFNSKSVDLMHKTENK